MSGQLHIERHGRVAILTLDDVDRRNALSGELVAAIVAAVADCEADAEVGALVVTGAAPAFCSGADVAALDALSGSGQGTGDVRDIYSGFLAVRDCSLPTVAAVNGPAVGAGFNLALSCDLRLASPNARFDSRFARIGLHPGGGHVWMLDRAVGPQIAAAMVLTGERLNGEEAAACGLVWKCVPEDELLNTAIDLAAKAAEIPRELARSIKQTLKDAPWLPDLTSAVAVEWERQQKSLAERDPQS